ncbi:hypothetical protein ACETU7_05465 [Rhodococcus sp. 3Y1]
MQPQLNHQVVGADYSEAVSNFRRPTQHSSRRIEKLGFDAAPQSGEHGKAGQRPREFTPQRHQPRRREPVDLAFARSGLTPIASANSFMGVRPS